MFLVGKDIQNKWDFTIQIQNGREAWEAGGETVEALTKAKAKAFNAGIPQEQKALNQSNTEGWRVVNRSRSRGTFYPAKDHDPPTQPHWEEAGSPGPIPSLELLKFSPISPTLLLWVMASAHRRITHLNQI